MLTLDLVPTSAGPSPASEPAITLSPAPALWARSLQSPPTLSPEQHTFRTQLGLPVDRPIVMSGHQAQFWHPGILAKLLALDVAARAVNAATAWLVPDQDTIDPELARFPARNAAGELFAARWPHGLSPQTVAAAAPTVLPPTPRETPATPSVAAGLTAMRESLSASAREPGYARQLTLAALRLACAAGPLAQEPTLVFASRFAHTDLFRAIVDHLRTNPARAARTYNRGIAAAPKADLRPLVESSPAGPELPLWRLEPGRPRAAVYQSQLSTIPPEQLAPRALLLTGLMRLAGCEIFIHGTGGAEYDLASETWLREWLNQSPWAQLTGRLALSAVATATLLLPLGVDPIEPETIARSRWTLHHARHNPAALGDSTAQNAKLAHVAMIRDLPVRSHARAEAFRVLHASLDSSRRAHHARLQQLGHDAAELSARARAGMLAADRTWPFPLHAPEALRALRARIENAFTF